MPRREQNVIEVVKRADDRGQVINRTLEEGHVATNWWRRG